MKITVFASRSIGEGELPGEHEMLIGDLAHQKLEIHGDADLCLRVLEFFYNDPSGQLSIDRDCLSQFTDEQLAAHSLERSE